MLESIELVEICLSFLLGCEALWVIVNYFCGWSKLMRGYARVLSSKYFINGCRCQKLDSRIIVLHGRFLVIIIEQCF